MVDISDWISSYWYALRITKKLAQKWQNRLKNHQTPWIMLKKMLYLLHGYPIHYLLESDREDVQLICWFLKQIHDTCHCFNFRFNSKMKILHDEAWLGVVGFCMHFLNHCIDCINSTKNSNMKYQQRMGIEWCEAPRLAGGFEYLRAVPRRSTSGMILLKPVRLFGISLG